MQAEKSYLPDGRQLPIGAGMDAVRKLILEKVENLSEVSKKIGKNHAYLQQFIKREIPKTLPEDVREALALILSVEPNALRGDKNMHRIVTSDGVRGKVAAATAEKPIKTEQPERVPLEVLPGAALVGQPDLPVYGTAQGGKGALVVSADAVDWVLRPQPLLKVKDGYGVIVTGDSMSPEHREGSIALVNPNIPPRAGDTCIFKRHDDDGTVFAVIKELRKVTNDLWHVRQYNPRRDFSLKRSEWQVCHVTVGNYRSR